MRTTGIAISALAFTLAFSSAQAASVSYRGITFPAGDISFADAVVDLTFGSPAPADPDFLDGGDALGPPDYTSSSGTGSVSLGSGGSITLEFVDNALTGSGSVDRDDLHIFEIGPDVEDTFVEISMDGVTFTSVGKVFGSTSSIDIDDFGFGPTDLFRFVRLTDDPDEGGRTGATVGADIDAVGAISTVETPVVPLPAAGWMLLAGLGGLAALGRRARSG